MEPLMIMIHYIDITSFGLMYTTFSCWFTYSQQELDSRRLLSMSGVRRKKLSSRRHRDSAASSSDDDDYNDDDDDSDDRLTDINDCCCQLCRKTCFLSAVSLHCLSL